MIDGTLRSLSEKGVCGTTVRSICGGASGSRGLIAHYFDNKDELLAAAFRDLLNEITESVLRAQERAAGDAVEVLKALPRTIFSRGVFTSRNSGAFLTLWHEVRFNPSIRRANRDFFKTYMANVQELFREAARQAGVKIDIPNASLGLIAMIDGLWLEISTDTQTCSRNEAIDLCCKYIDQQLKH
jgi:AcrR family transcriptional regulator